MPAPESRTIQVCFDRPKRLFRNALSDRSHPQPRVINTDLAPSEPVWIQPSMLAIPCGLAMPPVRRLLEPLNAR
jgi:hypothetical protein